MQDQDPSLIIFELVNSWLFMPENSIGRYRVIILCNLHSILFILFCFVVLYIITLFSRSLHLSNHTDDNQDNDDEHTDSNRAPDNNSRNIPETA